MANAVQKSILVDSPRYSVVHVYLNSDGAAGDEADTVLVDASALQGANAVSNLHRVQGCLTGFTARLELDGSTDAEAVILPDGQPFDFDFTRHNFPITKLTGLAGATGDVTVTTNGMTASGDEGFLIITVKKNVND